MQNVQMCRMGGISGPQLDKVEGKGDMHFTRGKEIATTSCMHCPFGGCGSARCGISVCLLTEDGFN